MTPFDKGVNAGKFIPVCELADRLWTLREALIASDAISSPPQPKNRRKLRGVNQKTEREAWQAMLFAHAYSHYYRLDGMSVRMEAEENLPHDATLQWNDKGNLIQLKVQLKEFPPESLNASISLKQLLARSVKKYARSSDLTLAVFISRTGSGYSIEIPEHNLSGLWIFGFTGVTKAEFVFLVGKDANGEHSNCKKLLNQ